MNKRILLTALLLLTIVFSIGTIYASEVNMTDSYATPIDDDTSISISDESEQVSASESSNNADSSNDVLATENSTKLSVNTNEGNATYDISKSVSAKSVTKYYKGSTKYTATFYDKTGKALASTNVKITVNGKTYTHKTNAKGVVSTAINLKPGTYKVVATNPNTGYKLTTTFKILSTITASNVNKVAGDSKSFKATFYKSNGKVLANKNIKFKVNGKTYTKKTNSKGVATLSVKSLKKGTYKIISYNTDGLTKTKTIKVVSSSTTKLTASSYTFLKSDSKTIQVKLLNMFGYAPNAGKVIKFTVNGKTYTAKTSSSGIAKLKLPSLANGVYTVKYKFAGNSVYKASSTSSKVTIIPSKTPTFTVKSTTTFGKGAGTQFKVALKSGSVALAGKTITLTLNGNKYTKTTDSSGVVSLPINLDVGKYNITYTNKAESKISSKTGTTEITVKERDKTALTWKSATTFVGGTQSVSVLLNSNGKAISGATVKLTANSKTYSATTSSSGLAAFKISLTAGNYTVSYSYAGDNSYAPASGSTKLTITKPATISIKNVIAGATTLKNYYDKNNKFPSTVTAGGVSFTIPEFLYVMSQAIYQLGNSNTKDIALLSGVSAPSSPSGDNIDSQTLTKANFIKVANNIASYIKTNKIAPNYASTAVGKIIYNELVDSFSRIVAFYGSNDRLPNYVVINYGSGSGISGTGLNEKNTLSDLTAYLKSTKNCQVNNSAIKKIVDSLTKGLSSDSAKAKAIYNYVRDTVSYSFYYDTKYGAAGTLSAKKGNCVDHSHLLVAMFRTADLPARYVHGNCKFTSGSTYGHVWVQVLVGNTWTVADATSSRNSLGSVANWNTKSFTLKGIYSSLSF